MKRAIILSLSFFVLFCFVIFAFTVPIFEPDVQNQALYIQKPETVDFKGEMPINAARCTIVIDAKTNNILFSHNAHEKRGMASTTKIMTALVAIENGFIDREFAIPKEAVGIEGSSVYLKEGEILTLRELLYCLMLESGNDAATAIALIVGGSVERFADMMNAKAQELGLENTHFTNPHGLSDENHYTTAYDLAIITSYAMQYPLFCEIASTKTASVRYDGKENCRRLVNHNKLLFGYNGAIGVKTGYTKRDGKCLVSSAERDGMRIIAVTLQDAFPASTHRTLLDFAFANYENIKLADFGDFESTVTVKDGERGFLTVKSNLPAEILLPKNTKTSCEIFLPQTLYAPIKSGDITGYAVFSANGSVVYIINLESTEDIQVKKKTLTEKLFGE